LYVRETPDDGDTGRDVRRLRGRGGVGIALVTFPIVCQFDPGETHCDGPMNATAGPSVKTSEAPARAGLVPAALMIVAGVATLTLSVASVALPDIGKHFDSSQTALDLIAVGYSLGLACSVLWLGALGDRYGRKLMLLLGTILAIPMSLLAGYAPSDTV